MKFSVDVYEVVRNPDMNSRMVIHQGRSVPVDTVPKKLRVFDLEARNHDDALRKANEWFKTAKRSVRSISFSALDQAKMIAYVMKE